MFEVVLSLNILSHSRINPGGVCVDNGLTRLQKRLAANGLRWLHASCRAVNKLS